MEIFLQEISASLPGFTSTHHLLLLCVSLIYQDTNTNIIRLTYDSGLNTTFRVFPYANKSKISLQQVMSKLQTTKQWMHIGFTFTGTLSIFYVNGVENNHVNFNFLPGTAIKTSNFIGKSNVNSQPGDFVLDESKISLKKASAFIYFRLIINNNFIFKVKFIVCCIGLIWIRSLSSPHRFCHRSVVSQSQKYNPCFFIDDLQ